MATEVADDDDEEEDAYEYDDDEEDEGEEEDGGGGGRIVELLRQFGTLFGSEYTMVYSYQSRACR